jgi:sarcosine oxidase gamma subunit
MPVVVHCIATATCDLIVARSFAEYLMAWLGDAALEFEIPAA